mgnify:CR=1 FL=1
MIPMPDHPLRYALVNELHARPFPALLAPCTAAYVAIKQPDNAANRDRARDEIAGEKMKGLKPFSHRGHRDHRELKDDC